MIGEAQRRTRRNGLIAIVLTALLVFGIGLVVLGGDGGSTAGQDSAQAGSSPDGADGSTPSTEPSAPLAIDDLSTTGVAELTGLALSDDTRDFLTASTEDRRQLDVTFVLNADAVDTFVAESGLPEPEDGARVVQHSSPLWKLNPDEGSTITATADERDGLRRAVEFIDAGDGTILVRATFTTA